MGYFSDSSKNLFLNQKIAEGDLFEQYEQALRFAKECIPTIVDALSGGEQRTKKAFPIDVVKELILNALVHRDYHVEIDSYFNIVKDEGFEILNPGALPAPRITPENIFADHPSIPPNRRIAKVLFVAGLIEQWGKGTSRVWSVCHKLGLPEPVWQSERGTVTVKVRFGQKFGEKRKQR